MEVPLYVSFLNIFHVYIVKPTCNEQNIDVCLVFVHLSVYLCVHPFACGHVGNNALVLAGIGPAFPLLTPLHTHRFHQCMHAIPIGDHPQY